MTDIGEQLKAIIQQAEYRELRARRRALLYTLIPVLAGILVIGFAGFQIQLQVNELATVNQELSTARGKLEDVYNQIQLAERELEELSTELSGSPEEIIRSAEDVQLELGSLQLELRHEPTGSRGIVRELLSDRSYGSPIAGALIVYESEDGLARVETTSGADGSYQIELRVGRYKVSVIHPNYLTYSTGSGFSVIPGPGYQTANYFLTVKEGLRCPPAGKFPSNASIDWMNQIDTPPEVQIFVNPRTVKIGEAFTVTVEGVDDANLSAVWWFGESTGDDDMDKAHWFDCGGQTTCSNSWTATATVGGTLLLSANGRDLAYPTLGEAHQASEGSGISCTTIEVIE